jgi:predicted ribosomally synthesized peptide with nif11-like leader
MSIESARKLYVDLLEQPDFAEEIYGIDDRAERWERLSAAGYDFTEAQWQQVNDEVDTIMESQPEGELAEEQLDGVVGGASLSWFTQTVRQRLAATERPPIQAMYGVIMPGGL